jgi:hypothetical protein
MSVSELGRQDTGLDDPGFIEPDGEFEPQGARRRGKSTVITLTTVIVLLVATALTVLGLGAADTAVANFDASSWLWSSGRGEVDRVNGVTARVDTRTKVSDSQNHEIQITQTDKYLILRDLVTGQVTALDLTTLQVSAVMPTTPGLGVSVALHGDTAFVIDSVLGQVRQLDPRTLAPTGDSVALPKGITPGGFDGKGLLWIAVPSEGTVVAIVPGADGKGPKVLRTITVARPGHDFELSTLDAGVAVLDNTEQRLSIVNEKADGVALPIDKPGIMPKHSAGTPIAVTIPDDRTVVLVDGSKVSKFSIAGTGPLGPGVYYAGRVYVPDTRAAVVRSTDLTGRMFADVPMPSATGVVELEVREGYLFINAPDGPNARVVDDKHVVREVNKYQEGVLGGDPPPPPPPAPDPEPQVTVPGAPQNVTSAGGNGMVTITWRKANDNGAPVTRYVVEGNGQQIVVGASQRSVEITGLTNGQSYRFTVYAVNSQGAGARAAAPPVTPTADVPDAPASVQATANPDGTVTVTWPASNGQGHEISSYRVTSITGGVTAPVGAVTDVTMTLAKGALRYGQQYAFTVVAINDINAASDPSPVSNTIVPFTVPGAPVNLAAGTVSSARGTIQVRWTAAPANGRPVTRYVIESPNGVTQVAGSATSATLNGFPDDTAVQVQVHAVNEAGDGPPGTTTARTIGAPAITVTAQTPSYQQVSVTFTPNNKGGDATCTFTVNGIGATSAACTTQPVTLTMGGVWPNNTYSYTLTITNPAGQASANGSIATSQLGATVICPNNLNGYCSNGIFVYNTPSQANPGAAIGSYQPGATFVPQCATAGGNVNATPWGGKNTLIWLRLDYYGQIGYFPWAWSSLDGGDNYGMIPGC